MEFDNSTYLFFLFFEKNKKEEKGKLPTLLNYTVSSDTYKHM
jgi:hypothetical protein